MGFAEIKRVHKECDLDELHNDIEWIFVGGVRLIVEGVVVRLDVGTTDQ